MTVTPTMTQFCHQTWQLESCVQLLLKQGSVTYIVTESTPFHPVSHIWPDHPADRGEIVISGESFNVDDCQVGAVELKTNNLFIGEDIPVKRDEAGWAFVVVHCIDNLSQTIEVNDRVSLVVDKAYQQSLSRGHSAGHLAYLALNKVLAAGYWRKDADRKDPHGHFDFNSYAQVTSFVTEDKCNDVYRLGKTIRKRGLNSAQMLEDLPEIESKVNEQLVAWLEHDTDVTMTCDGETLTSSRYWSCDLGEGSIATIPCGGTHVVSLSEFTTIKVTLVQTDGQNIEMQTDVIHSI
ncbi:alanyl-tRNA editing protein [Vibrio sp. ZSDE26]|uniref:Alanyl-tRNA editing protein n=1 Tax=Vibrio amylolyticus TaxID=2847292 RepID=A0A9X2BMX9_9VIBR|nr:alanyl-tRNA editing protein [Vibrio amylolyticus]MCK6265388.1 alanyl-tRNA editing protein [Vibrio amylolyticus]